MRTTTFFVILSLVLLAACDDGGGGGGGGSAGSGGATGSSSSSGAGGAGGAGQYCYTPLQSGMFDQSCTAPADCALKFHMIDCCGSLKAVGVNQADSASFDAAEAQCQAICDCASQPTIADDGMSSSDPNAFQVGCMGGVCWTSVQ